MTTPCCHVRGRARKDPRQGTPSSRVSTSTGMGGTAADDCVTLSGPIALDPTTKAHEKMHWHSARIGVKIDRLRTAALTHLSARDGFSPEVSRALGATLSSLKRSYRRSSSCSPEGREQQAKDEEEVRSRESWHASQSAAHPIEPPHVGCPHRTTHCPRGLCLPHHVPVMLATFRTSSSAERSPHT